MKAEGSSKILLTTHQTTRCRVKASRVSQDVDKHIRHISLPEVVAQKLKAKLSSKILQVLKQTAWYRNPENHNHKFSPLRQIQILIRIPRDELMVTKGRYEVISVNVIMAYHNTDLYTCILLENCEISKKPSRLVNALDVSRTGEIRNTSQIHWRLRWQSLSPKYPRHRPWLVIVSLRSSRFFFYFATLSAPRLHVVRLSMKN
jgi:hypothetical protein